MYFAIRKLNEISGCYVLYSICNSIVFRIIELAFISGRDIKYDFRFSDNLIKFSVYFRFHSFD